MMATSKKMLLIKNSALLLLLLASSVVSTRSLGSQPVSVDAKTFNQFNGTYTAEHSNLGDVASIFSPRMDFEQWKPLTGRGDPLRNDPTYDYEPPVLERVHYWADESRLDREHYPERKSEVLMLGVSSRKPSVTPRQPPLPPRKHQHLRPPPPKYEDYTYKLSDHYPMTILVPPPPPPPGHQPSLFILTQDKMPLPNSHIMLTDPAQLVTKETTASPEYLTSSYALQEANLIYQSSTTSQHWILDFNRTISGNSDVSSDYAGWGPTTPLDEQKTANDTHNFISNDQVEPPKQPYTFYKPMLSQAPTPPERTPSPLLLPTFLPTALPPTAPAEQATVSFMPVTWPTERTTYEISTETDYYEDITTEKAITSSYQTTPSPKESTAIPNVEANVFDMLGPMMSMPLVNDPERPQDNLYAHASENVHVYKNKKPEDVLTLETMQTMQPPPPVKIETSTVSNKKPYFPNTNNINSIHHKKPSLHTHDPYLHMRFTTPMPTTTMASIEKSKFTTEAPVVPMYLIIQGHSKVKTYGSKPKPGDDYHTKDNEIPKPRETNEVKHLHVSKEKNAKKYNVTEIKRTSKAHNLKALVDNGLGSIEIQEADVGIKYDVSDGSEVPIELYKKGIVDTDENSYSASNKVSKQKRTKRQIDLEDLLPFDEDTIEEYVYNFFEGKKNETSITGLIAQAMSSNAAAAVDDLEDDDEDNSEQEDEER